MSAMIVYLLLFMSRGHHCTCTCTHSCEFSMSYACACMFVCGRKCLQGPPGIASRLRVHSPHARAPGEAREHNNIISSRAGNGISDSIRQIAPSHTQSHAFVALNTAESGRGFWSCCTVIKPRTRARSARAFGINAFYCYCAGWRWLDLGFAGREFAINELEHTHVILDNIHRKIDCICI